MTDRHRRPLPVKFPRTTIALLALLSCNVALPAPTVTVDALPVTAEAAPAAVPGATAEDQRADYRAALAALARGDDAVYRSLLPRLQTYALLPYVEFAALDRRSTRLDAASLDEFVARFPDSPLREDVLQRWLRDAALSGDWRGYLGRYDARLRGLDLTCWRLEALYRTDAPAAALDAMPALWLSPRPLPGACDGIIALWERDRGIPEDLIWRRLLGAVAANDLALAEQLLTKLPRATRLLGARLLDVHVQPERLGNAQLPDTEHGRDVAAEGIRRLARSDATAASVLWLQFRESHRFPPALQRTIELDLLRRAADQDRLQGIAPIPATPDDDPRGASSGAASGASNSERADAVEAVLRYTIRHGLWSQLLAALRDLPPARQALPRWQYWFARATQLTSDDAVPGAAVAYTRAYRELASDRSFYGFLAADRLHQPPHLAADDAVPSQALLTGMAQRAGIVRAFELSALGEHVTARREWRYALAGEDLPHKLAAATVAARQHLLRLSIQTVIDAAAWDALALRFPTAFEQLVLGEAATQGLDPSWVYAVARQESAFIGDARSPSGALGLMQLMPGTAADVARARNVSLQDGDLLQPAVNVRLGTYYLAELYRNFGYHRVLAAAAYNAGPGRVRDWLQRRPASPIDVWIDSIPFDETQRYVQNVLVFAHIYSRRLGTNQPFLFDHER